MSSPPSLILCGATEELRAICRQRDFYWGGGQNDETPFKHSSVIGEPCPLGCTDANSVATATHMLEDSGHTNPTHWPKRDDLQSTDGVLNIRSCKRWDFGCRVNTASVFIVYVCELTIGALRGPPLALPAPLSAFSLPRITGLNCSSLSHLPL